MSVTYTIKSYYIEDDDQKITSSTSIKTSSTSSFLEDYITYDSENDVIRVNKTLTSDYDVIAYAENSNIGSIWDGMPVATASNLGGVKVNSSNSDIYLDSNDVLQVDFSNVTTENTYVNDVSFSNDTLTLTLNNNTTLETTIESGVWDETESGISYSDNVQIGGNTTISGDLTVNGTEFITNTETVEVDDNLIIINNNESGDGVTAEFAGLEIDRGGYINYQYGFEESSELFKVGECGDLQAVATRPDNITDDYIARWDDSNNRLKFVDTIDYDNDISNKPDIAYNSTIGLDDLDSLTTSRDVHIDNDLYVGTKSTDGNLNIREDKPNSGKTNLSIVNDQYSNSSDAFTEIKMRLGTTDRSAKIRAIGQDYGYINRLAFGVQSNEEWNEKMYIHRTNGVHILDDLTVNNNITADGEIEAYSSSDERLKTNIQDFSASELLSKMQPVQFNWNKKAVELNNNKDTDKNNYGLIAQELEKITPELVHNIYTDYKAINYEQIIPILIKGFKEQQKEINELKKLLNKNG